MQRFCCDQLCKQGRECPLAAPAPAEACTDIGLEEPRHNMGWTILVDAALAAVFLGALAVVLWRLLA